MDGNELLIGLGSLLLMVLIYFAGVSRTKHQHARNDSEARITKVLDVYMAAAREGRTNGFHGLVAAGVATLKSDAEIRELIHRIVQHDPRWDPRPTLKDVDTHKFFRAAVERRYNLLASGGAEALAAELRSKTG